jgi:hypothetical protein
LRILDVVGVADNELADELATRGMQEAIVVFAAPERGLPLDLGQ